MERKALIFANNSDGLFRFRHELLQELKKQYYIIASTPFDNYIPELEIICDEVIQTEFDRRSINPIKDFQLLKAYIAIIHRVNPDIIITYTIKPNVYGGIAARFARKQYAVNITGLGTAFEKTGIIRTLVIELYTLALKNAKVIFFENSGDRDKLASFRCLKKENTVVLPGAGVNTQTYMYQSYPHNEVVTFLFAGRVMKEKGIEEVFDAMKRLADEGEKCFLDIVGPFEENYKDRLEQYEKSGWLKYYGFQSDVRPFITICDCFVLPSYHEGMANTNLECAAMGRPVITSNIPGCKEAVIDGESGYLCEPKDVQSLYEAMKRMLHTSREERAQMGRVGRKHMEDVFDKRKVVEQTLSYLLGDK